MTYCKNWWDHSYMNSNISVVMKHSHMNCDMSFGLQHSYNNSNISVGLEHSYMNSNISVGLEHSYMNRNISVGLEHSYLNRNISVGLEIFVTRKYKLYDICLEFISSWPPHPEGDTHLLELQFCCHRSVMFVLYYF